MKTKRDLLRRMKSEGACGAATEWVESFPDETSARDIWLACSNVEWMCWFAFRGRPRAGVLFAFNEADIAIRVHAADALWSAGLVVEASGLRGLPAVTPENANAAAYAARAAGHAAALGRAAHAAADAAAHAAYASAYAARAAYSSAHANDCTGTRYQAECARKIRSLRALWDGKHGLEGRL